jgi:hypothetical protein
VIETLKEVPAVCGEGVVGATRNPEVLAAPTVKEVDPT